VRVGTNVTINSGGTLDMDASAASCVQKLQLQCASATQYSLTIASGGIASLMGRSKTHRTLQDGALTGGVSNRIKPDEDTGWETGDKVLLLKSKATNEQVTLNAKDANGWSFSEGTVTNSYADNTALVNLTRSCRIEASTTLKNPKVTFAAAPSALSWVQFDWCNAVTLSAAGATATGCSHTNSLTAANAWLANADRVILDRCVCTGWGYAYSVLYSLTTTGNLCVCTDCVFHTIADISVGAMGRGLLLSGCWVVGTYMTCLGEAGETWLQDCHVWGCSAYALYNPSTVRARGCFLGTDPGGNASANAVADIYGANHTVVLDDCQLNSTTPVSTLGRGPASKVVSLNHGRTSGYYKEWQQYGIEESDAANANGGTGYCRAITPNSTSAPFRKIITIPPPATTGKSLSVTLYAKGGGALGALTAGLGLNAAGLTAVTPSSGSLDANCRFTVTGSYVQKTINFTGTNTRLGAVELTIDVLNSSSGVLYLDDIVATWS
jgi:hypothetical protein